MKRFLVVFALVMISSPAHAAPLTWLFTGTTNPSGQFNGMSIEGLGYELRIFLDTDLPSMTFGALSDVFFAGPHQGEVAIATIGVLPVNPFSNVQYFAPGLGTTVTGVQYVQGMFSGIMFPSSISSDPFHLGPIPATAPAFGGISFVGPNGLSVLSSQVTTFSAVESATAVPEGGSTALFLACALMTLCALRVIYSKFRDPGQIRAERA